MKTKHVFSLIFILSLLVIVLSASAFADKWDDPATASDLSHVHKFGDWITMIEVSCNSYGEQVRICSVCGYKQHRFLDAIPHAYGPWSAVSEATDHSAHTEQRTCTRCGHVDTKLVYPEGTLRLWSEGRTVKDVQKILLSLGYLSPRAVDGTYGYMTEAAVKQFQEANGLTADGIGWPQTVNLILKSKNG